MGLSRVGAVARDLRTLFDGGSAAGSTEWDLLRRYLDRRDEDAFRAIVDRHGPMVLGVCRRMLADSQDVDDAFQVAFLTLAKKAGTLGPRDAVGPWLHGVACRVAMRARSASSRRKSRERSGPVPDLGRPDPPDVRELRSAIDEELSRLPPKYRDPVLLCYLDGLTAEEAGRRLGWPVGTVKGRLARARSILKGRLARRGATPSGFGSIAAILRESGGAVPPAMVESTALAALRVAAGRTPEMISATALSLLNQGVPTMVWNKFKAVAASLLVLGLGAAGLAYQETKKEGTPPRQVPNETVTEIKKEAITTRPVLQPPQPVPREVGGGFDGPSLDDVLEEFRNLDNPEGSKPIRVALEARVPLNFAKETTLAELVRYVKESTKGDKFPNGIPIYVDPISLQDVDRTMDSTVQIDLEGVPLKTTLALALKQLDLRYQVKDDLMIIDHEPDEGDMQPKPTALVFMFQKAMQGELTQNQYEELIELLKLREKVRELYRGPGGMGMGGGMGGMSPRIPVPDGTSQPVDPRRKGGMGGGGFQ